mgnify:CR=1 FL=1
MGPKKGKGKGKGAGDDEGPDQAEMNMILEAQVESLKQRLVLEQERANMAARKEETIRENEAEIDKEREQHQGHTHDIVKSMTSQYREMERGH